VAAPTDSARVVTNITTAATSHNVNVGSPVAGTLLIVAVRFTVDPGVVVFTGYTAFAGPASTDASSGFTTIFYRWADGTEGATDVCAPTNSTKAAYLSWEITGAEDPASLPPAASTVAIGTTTANTANPTSVSAPNAPQDTLYLAIMTMDGETNTPTASPTSYSAITVANSGTGGATTANGFVAGGSRALTASSSEDPGAFTHPGAVSGWSAFAVAIPPTGSAPPVVPPIIGVPPQLAEGWIPSNPQGWR
jgi:hypothetical protein